MVQFESKCRSFSQSCVKIASLLTNAELFFVCMSHDQHVYNLSGSLTPFFGEE